MFTSIKKELLETKVAECNEILPDIIYWWIWTQQYSFLERIKKYGISGN